LKHSIPEFRRATALHAQNISLLNLPVPNAHSYLANVLPRLTREAPAVQYVVTPRSKRLIIAFASRYLLRMPLRHVVQ
jgi:hypothetical protein